MSGWQNKRLERLERERRREEAQTRACCMLFAVLMLAAALYSAFGLNVWALVVLYSVMGCAALYAALK